MKADKSIKIHFHQTLASTNDELNHLIKKNTPEWTVVWTLDQTKGRGSFGSDWHVESGENITLSILLKPIMNKDVLFYFNFWVANTIALFLSDYFENVAIKWPNDLIVNNKKIGGILIENKILNNQNNCIVGIGINVNQANFINLPKATSFIKQTGLVYDFDDLFNNLMIKFQENYSLIKNNEFETIFNFYTKHLYKKDKVCAFKKGDLIFNGIIRGVDNDGCLVLETQDNRNLILKHKEVIMLF